MRKVQLTIKQEEVAPATTSDLVVMNNGKTLKEELSTNVLDKFSREVTVDSAMSKIIDGTLDGVYESCVFKGRSLVNLLNYSFPSRTNWYDNAGANSYIRTGQSISMLKPNTDYLMWFEGETTIVQILALSTVFTKAYFELTGKSLVKVRTVNGELPDNFTIHFKSSVGGSLTDNEKASVKLMLIEYIEGMEEWDIPYFEGICDVKMPILRNTGKNLFDVNLLKGLNSNVVVTDGIVTINNAYSNGLGVNGKKAFWFLKPNKTYRYSCTVTNTGQSNGLDGGFYFAKRLADGTMTYFSIYPNRTVTIPSDWDNYTTAIMYGALNNNGLVTVKNMQFEEANVTTAYEDYKTNILRTSEEIVLREVGGVHDTYNVLTGEYTQRVGEVVLDGSESWVVDKNYEAENHICYKTIVPNINDGNGFINILCDKFPTQTGGNLWNKDLFGISGSNVNLGGKGIKLSVRKSDLSSLTTDGLKEFLSQNPTTVQYQLESPIITKFALSVVPFAYKNGHIILESGYEGQSLLPELSYSVPVSKSGAISTTSKAILNHEQRLHKLEDLLLRESILMDYRLTLSFLNNM